MIVPAPTIRHILNGDATHTRVIANRPLPPWKNGQSLSIRASATHPAAGRITIIDTTTQLIADITPRHIREEGWTGRNPTIEFARWWIQRHDPGYRDALTHATDEEIMERLHRRHATTETWRIAIIPDPTQPSRLLAARSEHGYTTSPHLALPDEPEAVDAHTQAAITREAHTRDQARNDQTTALHLAHIDHLRRRVNAARTHATTHGLTPRARQALRQAEAQLRRAEHEIRDAGTR